MDVRLSPEQQALRDTAARLAVRLGPRTVADLDDAERAGKLDAAVAGAGWRELRAAGEGGEPLASVVEVALVAEELARRAADTAFLGPTLAAELRRAAGAPPSLYPETVALTDDRSELVSTVDGTVPPGGLAIDAAGSPAALLLSPVAGGHALAEVRLDWNVQSVDLTRLATVVDASAAAVLVRDQASVIAPADLTRWTALGLAVTCADLVGTMRGAIHLACEYATARRQFGVAIGTFQAVQHLLADAQVAMEGSRSVALHAAWAVDALPPEDALVAAAVAKAYCTRAARHVCETAIQVHGGIGNTWDCFAHVYLRRALCSGAVLGGAGTSLGRVLDHYQIGAARGLR